MSTHELEVDGLRERNWNRRASGTRPAITWWPASLPGTDLDERSRRRGRKPARPRIRRGRIQLVLAR